MKMEEFASRLREDVAAQLGRKYDVSTKEIEKNNGTVWHGLLIQKDKQNVAPTIYLEGFLERYEQGMKWEEIVERILRIYENGMPSESIDMEFYSSFDQVKDRIVYKLISADRNKNLLEKIPHIRFLDLAICFYYSFFHKTLGNGSILVYNNQIETWNTNTQELLILAQKNTDRLFGLELMDMEELLAELLDGDPKQEAASREHLQLPSEIPMKVLSNRRHLFGAVCMLYPGVLSQIAEDMGADLYILPSSVHEVILMPDSGTEDPRILRDMVAEVNMTQVPAEEVLSDHVYYYDREKKQITIV